MNLGITFQYLHKELWSELRRKQKKYELHHVKSVLQHKYVIIVYVYSLELPQGGNSSKYGDSSKYQEQMILKRNEKSSITHLYLQEQYV